MSKTDNLRGDSHRMVSISNEGSKTGTALWVVYGSYGSNNVGGCKSGQGLVRINPPYDDDPFDASPIQRNPMLQVIFTNQSLIALHELDSASDISARNSFHAMFQP